MAGRWPVSGPVRALLHLRERTPLPATRLRSQDPGVLGVHINPHGNPSGVEPFDQRLCPIFVPVWVEKLIVWRCVARLEELYRRDALGPWKEESISYFVESMSVSVREDYLSHGYGRICKLDSMKIPRMGDLVLKWILHGSSSIQLTIFQGGTCSFCKDLSRKFEWQEFGKEFCQVKKTIICSWLPRYCYCSIEQIGPSDMFFFRYVFR